MRQSFEGEAYFRVGPEGIEIRLGVPRAYGFLMLFLPNIKALPANPDSFAIRFPGTWANWDGRSYVYRFAWAEVEDVIPKYTLIDSSLLHKTAIRGFVFSQQLLLFRGTH